MQLGKSLVSVSPAAWISLAFSVILLPLDWVTAWLFALCVHETGHICVSLLCGARIHHIRFTCLGAQITADSLPHGQEIFCTLAGPASGLLLLLFAKWLPKTAVCGMAQAVYNLIPLMYLDGGRALRGILCLLTGEQTASTISLHIDRVTRMILCILCLYVTWRLTWYLALLPCCVFLFRQRYKKNSLQTARTAGTIVLNETNEVRL